ncbi:MAG: dihydropteroate synthase, partial [Wenzhouxiangellaceae bacterium]|nr:dihydropteroate synthase [Wenzhouxiangellaceae bacterium]
MPEHHRDLAGSIHDAAFAGRILVMGIVNVTPDSFSDGGRFDSVDKALAHAGRL